MLRARAARVCWGLTIGYWVALFVLTHLPLPKVPYAPVTDKTGHFVAYASLAIAMMVCAWLGRGGNPPPGVLVLGILLAYGAVDEWTQLVVNRSCELADWYADAAGAAAGVVTVSILAYLSGYHRRDV